MKIPDDVVLSEGPDLIELIMKARREAVARGIKADSIVINANMVYVPALFGERPEMICGLDVYLTKSDLPDGYSFAVLHDENRNLESPWIPVTERLPEKEGDYLIYATVPFNGRKFMTVMHYEQGAYLPIWSDTTHWMPLPEPPKEV